MDTVSVTTFEEVALLRTLGFEFDSADPSGRRVVVRFRDPDGRAADAIRKHNINGVDVNSLAYVGALDWAKRIIFAAKDSR